MFDTISFHKHLKANCDLVNAFYAMPMVTMKFELLFITKAKIQSFLDDLS